MNTEFKVGDIVRVNHPGFVPRKVLWKIKYETKDKESVALEYHADGEDIVQRDILVDKKDLILEVDKNV